MLKATLLLSALLASTSTLAAATATQPADIKTSTYEYGMQLDVAEVIEIAEARHDDCQPVPARMTYRDSQGEVRAVDYIKNDSSCQW